MIEEELLPADGKRRKWYSATIRLKYLFLTEFEVRNLQYGPRKRGK